MDEFQRIARLSRRFERPRPEVLVAIGDDAAVLAGTHHARVWTVDSAVEGVHFDRAFMSLEVIGARAFMAAASDVAAMGARAVAAVSSLILPAGLGDDELEALTEGIAGAAEACDCSIVGGNLARGRELSLTTSVLGECVSRFVTRSGGRPGDRVYVTGPLGGAALGLSLLQRGGSLRSPVASGGHTARTAFPPAEQTFVAAFLAPQARLDRAALVATSANAAIDVSDGLLSDLAHVCEASGVGARIERELLPSLPEFERVAREHGLDGTALLTSGGEDYELLFTSSEPIAPEFATDIGCLTELRELVLVDAAGRALPTASGFDHFRARPT